MTTPESKKPLICPDAPKRVRKNSYTFTLDSNKQRAAFAEMISDNPTMAAMRNYQHFLLQPISIGSAVKQSLVILHNITQEQAEGVLITLACYGCFLNDSDFSELIFLHK